MAEPSHANLFKLSTPSLSESVAKRRDRLLSQQKLRRQNSADDQREGIHDLVTHLTQNSSNSSSRRTKRTRGGNTKYKNTLQLSEWFADKPDDLDNWIMVGCPKGVRCLVVANAGKTQVFGKNGGFIRKMRSRLPGDAGNQQDVTILDCVFDKESGEYWVLDALAYGKVDFTNCDVLFRFYWIRGRIESGELDGSTDADREQAVFRLVRSADCADTEAMRAMLDIYPMYADNAPEVDGLLFYHKESSYVRGKTPLVGWLFPFMVDEVLALDVLHPSWMALRPADYVDASTFIAQFNAALKRTTRGRKGRDMEVTENDGEECAEMDADLYLEQTGETVDDAYYEVVN